MRRTMMVAALSLAIPAAALAHVSLNSWTSKARAEAVSPDPGSFQGASAPEIAGVEAWLGAYDAAFNAKDLEKLTGFCHPDVTIFEGGSINTGWVDYRDRHLGPELKEFQNLQFGHGNTKVTLLGDGRAAFVTSTYSLKARVGERDVDSGGLETLVLVKQGSDWKIRHSHTSSRPRRPAGGAQ